MGFRLLGKVLSGSPPPLWTFFLAMLSLSTAVQAWGPATHATHWRELKKTLTARIDKGSPRQAELADLLPGHLDAFIFGSVIPDIRELTPKGDSLRRVTHKYEFAFALLDGADTPAQRAFALGNLAHLAQDTGAQLFYVPHKMCRHRIGSFRLAGASQEDLIEGMVELHQSDAALLRKALRRRTSELVTFYAEGIERYLKGQRKTDDIPALVNRFCRLAGYGLYVAKPAGFVLNTAILPLSALKTGLANPLAYRDAKTFLRLGNTIFLDLAEKRKESDWYKHWPVWSRNVQLFAGTQGGKAFRRTRCKNGIILYSASFGDTRGKRSTKVPVGSGQCVLRAELSCTTDVTDTVTLTVLHQPAEGSDHRTLATVQLPISMRVADPNHRQSIAIPFPTPALPGMVYFTMDVEGGPKGIPELSSLTPGSKKAQEAGWPPVLEITVE